jgi:GNAT superfamily N-acetyltransferase
MTEIRPFRDEDAAGAAALLRELVPHFVITTGGLRHWLASLPPRTQGAHWVAVAGGEVVGWADSEFQLSSQDERIGLVWAGVRQRERGKGLGTELYELAERHMLERGAWKLESWVDGPEGRSFLERRGFVHTRSERLSSLDTRTADVSELPTLEAALAAEGFRVLPLAVLRHRPREAYALFNEAHLDAPADDEPRELDFEEWTQREWENPLLDFELSAVVLHHERPVSFAWLSVDREGRRAEHELTGTLRAYRGRGLARLAKLAAIRWCRKSGIDTLLTGNDSQNAPMLAINDRLGYRPTIVREEMAKEVRARESS